MCSFLYGKHGESQQASGFACSRLGIEVSQISSAARTATPKKLPSKVACSANLCPCTGGETDAHLIIPGRQALKDWTRQGPVLQLSSSTKQLQALHLSMSTAAHLKHLCLELSAD